MDGKEVFEILAREHADMLWAYLRSVVFDPHAAEDLFQDAMLVAWRRLPEYDQKRPFGAWLRGIGRVLVMEYIRKAGNRRVALADPEALEALSSRFSDLEDGLPGEWEIKVEALRKCMQGLAETDRRILNLHYHADQNCGEIGESLELGAEAVKKRLQRARASLAECVQRRAGKEVIRYGT